MSDSKSEIPAFRLLLSLLLIAVCGDLAAQQPKSPAIDSAAQQDRIQYLEKRVHTLESDLDTMQQRVDESLLSRDAALLLWLFGAFCALWAQNTGRSPWLWFFIGVIFHCFAVLAVLLKNPGSKPRKG